MPLDSALVKKAQTVSSISFLIHATDPHVSTITWRGVAAKHGYQFILCITHTYTLTKIKTFIHITVIYIVNVLPWRVGACTVHLI